MDLFTIFGEVNSGFEIFQVLAPWDETTVTSATIGAAQIGDTVLSSTATVLSGGTIPNAFTIPADVVDSWLNGENYGVAMMLSGDWDNVEWRNKNNGTAVSIGYANLNISTVPEPSTYALLLGVGSLGFLLMRRRRS